MTHILDALASDASFRAAVEDEHWRKAMTSIIDDAMAAMADYEQRIERLRGFIRAALDQDDFEAVKALLRQALRGNDK